MNNNYFYTINDVAEILKVSYSKASLIVRKLNEELNEKKIMTTRGRVVRTYFCERYGVEEARNVSL